MPAAWSTVLAGPARGAAMSAAGFLPDQFPDFDRLTPAQQMGISCVRCGRRLGASGWRIATLRDRWGHAFTLWVCAPACPPRNLIPRAYPAA
jgi:hypothetical protein